MNNNLFFKAEGPYTLRELKDQFGGKIVGDENKKLYKASTLSSAIDKDITFFSNRKYIDELKQTKAGACLITEDDSQYLNSEVSKWIVVNPYEIWAKVLTKMYPSAIEQDSFNNKGYIHSTAQVHKDARVGQGVYIGENAVIGAKTSIASGCYIGSNSKIGDNCNIYSNVTIANAIVGDYCIIHPGVRIGQDGFGFAQAADGLIKVPQIGKVIVGDHVEIGANTCIDRGAIEDTSIGSYTKIDNLVQIGHNVSIGDYCIIVSQVGIAGSTKIGNRVVLGGQSGIAGHLTIEDGVTLAGKGAIIKDAKAGEVLGGIPAVSINQWHRQTAILKKLATQKGDING